MKHSPTRLVTALSARTLSRGVRKNVRFKTTHIPKPTQRSGGLIDHCYRALLEASSTAVLLLSPESIILEWNRAAETLSGWTADQALGRRYVELCLPMKARESFLAELARIAEGSDVRGLEIPLLGRAGSQTMLSWNISRVLGTHGNLNGLMAIGTVVVHDKKVEEELRLAHARVRSEARRAQKVAEEERRRIARELHDEFGQALTGLKFDLAWCGTALTQSPAPTVVGDLLNKLQAMSGSVDALLGSVRATAAALRPAMLDDLGLIPALESLVTMVQHRTGAQCTIAVNPELSSMTLPSEVSTALFRIGQELLTNVMRHADASQVSMRLYQDGGNVTLAVTDNGKGIPTERPTTARSFGLRGMQERASLLGGHFSIVGTPGGGTTACASVPMLEGITS
jgi:PAS domain S-box-containing protein